MSDLEEYFTQMGHDEVLRRLVENGDAPANFVSKPWESRTDDQRASILRPLQGMDSWDSTTPSSNSSTWT